jgi:release factor glutamine methyltransferase
MSKSQILNLLERAAARLGTVSETPNLDAQVLLAEITGKPRTWVMSHLELELDANQLASLQSAMRHLGKGEPLPYVLGHWSFFGLDLEITPEVLIPRPETELMIEKALDWLRRLPERRTVADVGTGSGCIAVALAVHMPSLQLTATDISPSALEVAERNARKFGVERRITFIECDLLPPHSDPLPSDEHFDLICANLPYIPTETLQKLRIYGREPSLALDGGPDGLDLIRRLIGLSQEWLAPDGMVLLELESSQGAAVLSLAYDSFSEAEIHLHQDLAGHDRLLEIHLPAEP